MNLLTILGITLIIGTIMHEAAHYLAARLVKCGITIFSIGFGKSICHIVRNKIRYQVCWILLGGYCALKGELTHTKSKDAFINLPYRKKFIIAIAGCAANILIGALCMFIGLVVNSMLMWLFGYFNIILGVTNLVPFFPCLDGGYVVYLPLFFKLFGKRKGLKIFTKWNQISFNILMWGQAIMLPWIIYYYMTHPLTNV